MPQLLNHLENSRLQPPRILFVEDSKTSQKILKFQLKELPMSFACSIMEARHQLQFVPHDLIITDFNLTSGDGFDVISLVRSSPTTEHIPILAVSGSMDHDLTSRLLLAGANRTLPKPFDATVIRRVVAELLKNPEVRQNSKPVNATSCFRWIERGMHYLYNPEAGITAKGSDLEAAKAEMRSLLKSVRGKLGTARSHGVSELQLEVVQTHILPPVSSSGRS